jgi:HK97 family phage portal protein
MSDIVNQSLLFRIMNWFSPSEVKQLQQVEKAPETVDHGATWIQPYGVRATYSQEEAMTAYAGHGYTYAAVSRSSQDLAALPLRLLKGKDKTLIEEHPVIDLLNQPSTTVDGFLFREQLCTDLILTGNCYILLLGSSEQPSSIVRLHPAAVKIQTGKTGITGYLYDAGGQTVQYPVDRVVHGRLASWSSQPSQVLGTGAIEPLSREIRADINSQNLVSDASAKARPDLLIYPKDPADIWGPETRREIASEYKKMSAQGGAMVLSGLAEVEPLQLSAREMEYVEARKMARESISAVIGVPPSVLGLPTANYATSRQEARNYWTVQTKRGKRLAMLFSAIAQRWEDDLYFEHDYSGVEALQDMRTEQLNRVQMHILNGISPRAAYKYEGLEYPEDIEGNEEAADLTDETAEDARSFLLKVYTSDHDEALEQIAKAYQEEEPKPKEEKQEDTLSTFENRKEAFESLNENTQEALTKKAADHLEAVGDDPKKQTDRYILAVSYLRGIGAYESNPESVRPTVSSAEQWAMARVNGLLYALRNQKYRRSPFDTDLLPPEHPLSTRGEDEERRHLLFGYEALPLAPKDSSWGFTEADAKSILGEGDFDKYADAFLFVYRGREDDSKGYRLPIAKLIDGELKIVFRGVIAAGSALRKEPKFNQGYYNLNRISEADLKRMYGIIEKLYAQFDEEAPAYPERKSTDLTALKTKAVGDVDPSNFPQDGDDEEVSLKNSGYEIFDWEYAEDLKENWPEIWAAGGNIEGNNQYRRLLPIVRRQSQEPQTETEEMAIRKREAWSARHFEDGAQFNENDPPSPNLSSIAGIVAQIKWFTVGALGETRMKEIIDEVKAKQTKTKARRDLWRIWARDIGDPALKEIQLAANAYLRGAIKRYQERLEKYVEPTSQQVNKSVIDWSSLLAENEEIELAVFTIGARWRKWFTTSGNQQLQDILRAAGREARNATIKDDGYSDEHINLFARQIARTGSNAIQRIVENGLVQGFTIDDIASDISEAFAFSPQRALMIARTESTNAANLGAQRAYAEAEADGIKVQKQWLSSRDSKVRDSHAALDGQTVGANENFVNETGDEAAYPAGFGIASEDINCRCTMIPIVD